jgi:FkbM family methyltransferase
MTSGQQETIVSNRAWIARAWSSVRDGRVPHRVQVMLDRVLPLFGSPFRRIQVRDLTVEIRRNSWDESAARRVVGALEYNPKGSEIQPGDTVIDIGANIGAFALAAAVAAPNVRVLAFEPDADNCALATRNAQLNGLNGVQVFRLAVAGEPGMITLFQGDQFSLHTTVPGRLDKSMHSQEVEAITLKEIMDRHNVNTCGFLKMDCEGAEYEILYKTPPEYLARIKQMAIKYHATENKQQKAKELCRFLEQMNFEIFELRDHRDSDDGLLRARSRS